MLVFLDIDGVMVPINGWKSPELLEDGFPSFSSKATIALQKLISGDDTVMLTTSHKANFSIERWKEIFERRSIKLTKLGSLPDNKEKVSRKDEIIRWFNLSGIKDDFVIIDDDKSLNELPQFLKKNLIQTSSYIGLTEQNLIEYKFTK